MCELDFKVYAGDTVGFWKQRAMMLDAVCHKETSALSALKEELAAERKKLEMAEKRIALWETACNQLHNTTAKCSYMEKAEQAEASCAMYLDMLKEYLGDKLVYVAPDTAGATMLTRMKKLEETLKAIEKVPSCQAEDCCPSGKVWSLAFTMLKELYPEFKPTPIQFGVDKSVVAEIKTKQVNTCNSCKNNHRALNDVRCKSCLSSTRWSPQND